MAPTPLSSTRQTKLTRTLTILAIFAAAISSLIYYLDSHLERFYIFDPDHLHDLSLRALDAHGNDTRSVVAYIVAELNEKLPGGYINLDEEWVFNNAGGAMGGMYIMHASRFPFFAYLFTTNGLKELIFVRRYHRVLNYLWYVSPSHQFSPCKADQL